MAEKIISISFSEEEYKTLCLLFTIGMARLLNTDNTKANLEIIMHARDTHDPQYCVSLGNRILDIAEDNDILEF